MPPEPEVGVVGADFPELGVLEPTVALAEPDVDFPEPDLLEQFADHSRPPIENFCITHSLGVSCVLVRRHWF